MTIARGPFIVLAARPAGGLAATAILCAGLGAGPAASQEGASDVTLGQAFSVGPAVSVTHDNNFQRLPQGQAVGETVFSTDLIGAFHDTYGRESVSLGGDVGRNENVHFKQYNYTHEDLQASLQASLPLSINGGVSLARNVHLARFSDIASIQRDVIATNSAGANLDFPLTVDWRGVLSASGSRTRDSNPAFQAQDSNQSQESAGIRYAPVSGNHIDLQAHAGHANFPNGSSVSLINTSSTNRGADFSVDWTFTGASYARGHAGFDRQTYPPLAYFDCTASFGTFCLKGHPASLNRDVAGPVYDLTYRWQATGATGVTFTGSQQHGAAGDNFYLSAVSRSYRVAPDYQASAKIRLGLSADWARRNYLDNVYQAIYQLPPGTMRQDIDHSAGFNGDWTPRRWLQVSVSVQRESRNSTIPQWTYRDLSSTLSVRATFD